MCRMKSLMNSSRLRGIEEMANRKIVEIKTYTREEIGVILKFATKNEIIDHIYFGEFHSQSIEWKEDGSAQILTEHTPKCS